jgi:NAD-reducing hydrogenase large subunit
MTKTVVINPVTRSKAMPRISIFLDDGGEVDDVRFHVVEYRRFREILRGTADVGDGGNYCPNLRDLSR